MGAVTFSIDTRLVASLKSALPLTHFVETGTFKGDSVATVEPVFDRIITIEYSKELWHAASRRFAAANNIETLLGESAAVLQGLSTELASSATLYWLDAHWCVAADTSGSRSQCPLLSELKAIGKLGSSSVVLIDDARLFLAPPPEPHDVSHWPSFEDVLSGLRELSDEHEVLVVNDVIAFYPREIRQVMYGYARSFGFDLLAATTEKSEIIGLVEELKEKEKVIREQKELLDKYAEELQQKREFGAVYFALETMVRPMMPVVRPIYRALEPKLGKLNQHSSREIRLPRRYSAPMKHRHGLPSIAMVTPSFNQGGFISRTIRSVIEQSYPDVTYFVQDGASSDDSRQVIEQFAEHLSGWESCPDDGQAQAINRAFGQVAGDLMAWLNSDDVLLPGALGYVADFFARNPEVDVVYGHRLLIDENDGHVGDWVLPKHDDDVLSWVDFVPQETMFWRREIWERVGGGLDESFQFAMDWDLLIRFRDAGARFVRVPRFLGGFRVHPEQKTAVAISEIGITEMNRIRMRTLGRIPTRAEIQKAVMGYLLRHVGADVLWRMKRRLVL